MYVYDYSRNTDYSEHTLRMLCSKTRAKREPWESPSVHGREFSSTLIDHHQVWAKREKSLDDSREKFDQVQIQRESPSAHESIMPGGSKSIGNSGSLSLRLARAQLVGTYSGVYWKATFPVGGTSASFGKSWFKHSKSFRIILSNQKLARALTSTPKAITPENKSCCLATSGKKTAGSVPSRRRDFAINLYLFPDVSGAPLQTPETKRLK